MTSRDELIAAHAQLLASAEDFLRKSERVLGDPRLVRHHEHVRSHMAETITILAEKQAEMARLGLADVQ